MRLARFCQCCVPAIPLVAALLLAFPICPECAATKDWGPGPRMGMVGLGLFAGALLLGLRLAAWRGKDDPRVQRWSRSSDALVALLFLGGCVLIGAGASVGVHPCRICYLFWGAVLVLLLEVAFSNRPLARHALAALLAGTFAVGAVTAAPGVRAELRQLVPQPVAQPGGLLPGAKVPAIVGLPNDGFVAFSTNCPVCAKSNLIRAVRSLVASGRSVTVVRPDGAKALGASPKAPEVALPVQSFRALRVDPAGPPVIAQFRRGTVASFKFANDYLGVQ